MPTDPSPTCIALIKHWETLQLKAYMPTPDDRPTLGWGNTTWRGKPVRMGMTCTEAEAEAVFIDELGKRARALNGLLKGTPTSQPQFDALLSWVYNVGVANAKGSTLLRHHLAGHTEAAHAQFSLWIYQNRKRLNGLIKRRAMEGALYMTPEGRDPPWLIRLPQRPGLPDVFQIKEPRL